MSGAGNAEVLRQFMQRVWNENDLDAIEGFLGDAYTIHSDPGDAWEGRTLTRAEFRERLVTSRAPFPDLHFDVRDTLEQGDRVAITWTMRGTQTGPMMGRPASGRTIAVQGMTVYHFTDGRITGHQQVVDRLAVAQQLGLFG